MYTQSKEWKKIDSKVEIKYVSGIKYTRPIDSFTLSIDCPNCKNLVSTIEDCLSLKENKLCEECFINKSFSNKDNN
jgi:hypothetical protein